MGKMGGRLGGSWGTDGWQGVSGGGEGGEELEDEGGDFGGALLLGPVSAAWEDGEDAEVGDDVADAVDGWWIASWVAGAGDEEGGLVDDGVGEVGGTFPVAVDVAVPGESAAEPGCGEGRDVDLEVGRAEPGGECGWWGEGVDEAGAFSDGPESFGGRGVAGDGPEESGEEGADVGLEFGFGEAWLLEVVDVVDVVGPGRLAQRLEWGPRWAGGVGDAEGADGSDEVRVAEGGMPGDGRAPIVPDDDCGAIAGVADEGSDVASECFEVVGFDFWRGGAGSVAALVGNDDPIAGRGEGAELVAPGVGEFGETVEEDDGGAGTGFVDFEVDAGSGGNERPGGAWDHALAMTSGSKVVAMWPAAVSFSIWASSRPRTWR